MSEEDGLWSRIIKAWAVIVTILTVAMYLLGRWWLATFYEQFGLEPEDAGLDQASVLLRLAPAALTVLGVIIGTAIAVWLLLALIRQLVQHYIPEADNEVTAWIGEDPGRIKRVVRFVWRQVADSTTTGIRRLRWQVPLLGAVLIGFVMWSAVTAPGSAATKLLAGEELDAWTSYLFPVKIRCVETVWLRAPSTTAGGQLFGDREHLLLLGQSGGTLVLSTSGDSHRTIRVPTSQVAWLSADFSNCTP